MSAPQFYPDLIYVGRIIKTHGIKGEVSAQILTDSPNMFHQGAKMYLVKDRSKKEIEVQYCFMHKANIVIKCKELNSLDDAEKWIGYYLSIPPYSFAEEENCFKIYQLYNLKVFDEKQNPLGTITDIIEYKENCLLVIEASGKKVNVPFIEQYCKINLKEGTLTIPSLFWKQLHEL